MKNVFGITCLLVASTTVAYSQEIGVARFAEGQVQHTVYAKQIQWKPCPPNVPKNCEMIVLSGHPQKPDMFTVRFRATGDFYMPPHTHPKDERVTLLEGEAAVAFGEKATRQDAKEFGPGDYYINKRGSVHKVWMVKGAVMQITGIGPWEIHFVDKH
ncbi:MAG: cupin domain-containing protein [Gammaproteobacteria bacterium]|nr:cupin domain-containing protein [Gammaproteobacteria bacterium]MDH5801579.1 cupin domain-containing protein [Gammaproteobacteria bacterium]